MIQQRRWLVE